MKEYITLLEYLIQTNKCYFDEHSKSQGNRQARNSDTK